MRNFLAGCCFSWPALHTAKGSVLSWAWAQAEGRAREGPLPFRRGGGATVISETGRPEALGCLPHPSCWQKSLYPLWSPGHTVLQPKPLRSPQLSPHNLCLTLSRSFAL